MWRRWPARFDALACCIGAAVPDVVDGVIGLARGNLGQSYGHGLAGLIAICWPVGIALHLLAKAVARRTRWASRLTGRGTRPGVEAWSVLAGALSHLVFDFVSHGNFLWLYPWYVDEHFFPSWWYARWLEIPLPFYREPYPLGPHLLVWIALSALGIVLFFTRVGAPQAGR